MKGVAVPAAGGIARLRNSDTLVLRNAAPDWDCELADNPAIGKRIIHCHRVATAASLAGAAKASPD